MLIGEVPVDARRDANYGGSRENCYGRRGNDESHNCRTQPSKQSSERRLEMILLVPGRLVCYLDLSRFGQIFEVVVIHCLFDFWRFLEELEFWERGK